MRIQNEAPIQTGTNTYSLLLLKFSMRTGAERRHRTFEPWQGSKKRTIPIWYRSFFKRETGIEAFSPVARVFQRLARGNLATGRGRSVRFTGYYVSLLPKVGEPPQAAVLPPTFET